MTIDREDRLKHFLTEKGAIYKDQKLTSFGSSPTINQRHAPALSVLDQRSLLRFYGPDTVKLLQGQLTNNVEKLAENEHQNSSVCNPKGRMYSSFTLLNAGNDQFLLGMHSGLLKLTQTAIGKYAVFFKTEIKPASEYVCLGLSGSNIKDSITALFSNIPKNNQAALINENSWLLSVDGLCDRYELWLPLSQMPIWWDKLTEYFTPASDELWRLLDIEAVMPSLRPAALEKYIPQHFNLPSLKAVSFRKGCYTGQEIVARMQNLGQLKSRSYRLTSNQTFMIEANAKLFNSAGKSIGEVLDCVPAIENNGTEILAVIRVDSAEKNDVQTNPEEGLPLNCHPIPYDINPKEELQY